MYRKILVPLDGSELAECILPNVEALGKGGQVSKLSSFELLSRFGRFQAQTSFSPPDMARDESSLVEWAGMHAPCGLGIT